VEKRAISRIEDICEVKYHQELSGNQSMSLEKIHLRKLLKIFYLPARERVAVLREDIRNEIQKERGEDTDGGDFYSPFWADAKNHVAGKVDLQAQVKSRIGSNKRRERLYPQLADGFLSWWNEKRRWRNEPFEFLPENVKVQFPIPKLRGVVKIENLLALKVGDQSNRIIYPYFSEKPKLPDEGGRIGLWLLGEALPNYRREDLRILDILRGTSFAAIDYPLQGNERDLFLSKYEGALKEWKKLRKERI